MRWLCLLVCIHTALIDQFTTINNFTQISILIKMIKINSKMVLELPIV